MGLILPILLVTLNKENFFNQNFFQNIFEVKAVQNRPQNIRKMRQFYICITNCFMTIQNRVNFANFVSNFKQRKLLNQNFFQNIF